MSFLEQYKEGACEQVWTALMQLGPTVREEPIYSDAKAVAQETMRRVRQNIETLFVRLLYMGFVFGYDHRVRSVISSSRTNTKYLTYLELFSWIQKQPPIFLDARLGGQPLDIDENHQVVPNLPETLRAIEQEIGPVPLSVSAWYSQIGAVNFYGYYAPWDELVRIGSAWSRSSGPLFTYLMSYCDPLQVRALDKQVFAVLIEEKKRHGEQWPFVTFAFADDVHFKDYTGGSPSCYTIQLPDARADADTWGMTFVEYLRLSLLSYAGFPGMAQWPVKPEKDLAMLTEGLQPF